MKFVIIEGAGHVPQVERPGEFVAAMKRVGGGVSGQVELIEYRCICDCRRNSYPGCNPYRATAGLRVRLSYF